MLVNEVSDLWTMTCYNASMFTNTSYVFEQFEQFLLMDYLMDYLCLT